MSLSSIFDAVYPVLHALEEANVPYCLGGSLASSIHGIARATLDADLACLLDQSHIAGLMESLGQDYYIDPPMIEEAIAREACFNLIHLPTMFKVDIFVVRNDLFSRACIERGLPDTLSDDEGAPLVKVTTAEDIVLHKLIWFRNGDRISERQWRDAAGVVKVKQRDLDFGYMKQWAKRLRIIDLLEELLDQNLA